VTQSCNLPIVSLLYRALIVGLNFKQFDSILQNYIGKYPDLVILNPWITLILMIKFNPTITVYLVPYSIEWHNLLLGESTC